METTLYHLPILLIDFLQHYRHPACILQRAEFQDGVDIEHHLNPSWVNTAYTRISNLTPKKRKEWQHTCITLVLGCLKDPENTDASTAVMEGWAFSVASLHGSYVVVTTVQLPSAQEMEQPPSHQDHGTDSMHANSQSESAPSDPLIDLSLSGTVDPFLTYLSQSNTIMGRMIVDFPWHQTPLGPIRSWDPHRKMAVSLVITWPDRMSAWLRVGDTTACFYNDGYIAALGKRKHPRALGKSFEDVHPEIWHLLEKDHNAALSGQTIYYQDALVMMDREPTSADDRIMIEESYHTFGFVPIRLEGKVTGYVAPNTETTSRVIAERRLETLRDIQAATSTARTTQDFYHACVDALSKNAFDLPFALLYTVRPTRVERTDGNTRPAETHYKLELQRKLGVPDGHDSAPASLLVDLEPVADAATTPGSNGGAPWPFADVLSSRRSIMIPDIGARSEGFERRGWDHPCHRAFVTPIGGPAEVPRAVLIVGLNPCRPYNKEYTTFLELLRSQISNGLTSVQNFETERQKAEELASLDRAKTVFFGNVSHELRTPLTLILSPVIDILNESQSLDPLVRQRLGIIQRNATRLHALVNSLLDFARLEAGRYLATFRPVNLSNLTADLASLFRSAIERGNVEFVVDCQQAPQLVYIDENSWEKIVTNLISNAFKYCLEGRIDVRVYYTNDEALFSCSDTGCGIPESELENIFKRFHRVESNGRSHEGTGIGLALTFETVKSLGGKLEVKSELGRGSTFTVKIPLGTAHIPPERLSIEPPTISGSPLQPRYGQRLVEEANAWLITESPEAPAPAEASTSASPLSPRERNAAHPEFVVVLADDNADLRQYCSMLLSKSYVVKAFADGQAAFDYARHNHVDLILSDVQMPKMDGYALLRAVRSEQSLSLLPVILLSAAAGSEARAGGLTAGADDYLVKPFSADELVARVKTHVELGRKRNDLEERVRERTRLLLESESRLQAKVEESERLRKQQEIVVDLTSHELRNPLNATYHSAELVDACLEQLRRLVHDVRARSLSPESTALVDKFDRILEEAEDAVENIMLSVSHQTRIAEDILNFSKISMSLLTIRRTPFHLFSTAQDICRMLEIEAREHGIALELVSTHQLEELWIKSDPQRFSQIIINFLTNAIRFTTDAPERHITVTIDQFTEVSPPSKNAFRIAEELVGFNGGFWIRVAVKDTGPGLSPQESERLFERFSQAHPSKDQFSGGHGLGLFVSRHLVMLLGGYIEVESVKGEGCTFAFAIPVEKAEPQAESDQWKGWRARILGRKSKMRTPPIPLKLNPDHPKHILIVEDNMINQKVLVRQLQARGFQTSAAGDGQEALDRILGGGPPFDVVLMDIEMPVKDGKTACRELREIEARTRARRLAVIAVTGNARAEQIQDCLAAGFDQVAIKPYRMTDLLRLMDTVLSIRA